MKRRGFNILAAVSLLACLMCLTLWALSYDNRGFWLTDPLGGLRLQSGGHVWSLSFIEGYLTVQHFLPDVNAHLTDSKRGWHVARALGYAYFEGGFQRCSIAQVALWLVVGSTALPPLAWVAINMFNAHRRLGRGFCRSCSYDLTGNTSGVCPECGTAVGGKAEGVS